MIAYEFKIKSLLSDETLRNQAFVDDDKYEEVHHGGVNQEKIKILKTKSKRKLRRKSKEKDGELNHLKVPNDEDYQCFICNEHFDLISEKDIHVKKDHKNDLKVCPICSTSKKTAISFESHLRYHKYGFRFLCCKSFFKCLKNIN